MRPDHRYHRHRGQILVSFLMITLVWGAGATALVRWTMWLLQADRAALQSRFAAQALQTAMELGSSATLGQPAGEQDAARTLLLPDGTSMLLFEVRRSDGSEDPARGSHVRWSAQWEDPWGRKQTLVLQSFWATTRRIY